MTLQRKAAAAQNELVVGWAVGNGLVDYKSAVTAMEERVAQISAGKAPELIWLLEHPPLYTAGTSAREEDLIVPDRFPVYRTGRGGQYTYHGPGQRVVYVMLDLKRRGSDVRKFVETLEAWIIATLAEFGVTGEVRPGRVGVWVRRDEVEGGREDKIAAIGIRVRRWVTFHGLSINVSPALDHFDGIVPCGIANHGVTSLHELCEKQTDMARLDRILMATFGDLFDGRVVLESAPH